MARLHQEAVEAPAQLLALPRRRRNIQAAHRLVGRGGGAYRVVAAK